MTRFRWLVVNALLLAACVFGAPLRAASSTGGGTTDDFTHEFAALEEAVTLLQGVRDEELLQWARLQNRVSTEMWRLKKEPFWETQKLQEVWTLISDPFSRPGSLK